MILRAVRRGRGLGVRLGGRTARLGGCCLTRVQALHFVVKTLEKILGHGLGRTIDEPLPQLRDLAAHRGVLGVLQLAAWLASAVG